MRWKIVLSVGLVLLVGCPHKPPTSGTMTGTVTYKGQPVNDAALSLYPAAGGPRDQPIVIPVTQEGTFSTTNIPPGDYKIVVEGRSEATPGGSKGDQYAAKPTISIPKKYKDRKTTDLKVTVEAGQQKLDLQLND